MWYTSDPARVAHIAPVMFVKRVRPNDYKEIKHLCLTCDSICISEISHLRVIIYNKDMNLLWHSPLTFPTVCLEPLPDPCPTSPDSKSCHLVYHSLLFRRHRIISFTLWLTFLLRFKVLILFAKQLFSSNRGTKCSQEWNLKVPENKAEYVETALAIFLETIISIFLLTSSIKKQSLLFFYVGI